MKTKSKSFAELDKMAAAQGYSMSCVDKNCDDKWCKGWRAAIGGIARAMEAEEKAKPSEQSKAFTELLAAAKGRQVNCHSQPCGFPKCDRLNKAIAAAETEFEPCKACDGRGWFLVGICPGLPESIERCLTCKKFPSDLSAARVGGLSLVENTRRAAAKEAKNPPPPCEDCGGKGWLTLTHTGVPDSEYIARCGSCTRFKNDIEAAYEAAAGLVANTKKRGWHGKNKKAEPCANCGGHGWVTSVINSGGRHGEPYKAISRCCVCSVFATDLDAMQVVERLAKEAADMFKVAKIEPAKPCSGCEGRGWKWFTLGPDDNRYVARCALCERFENDIEAAEAARNEYFRPRP